MLGGMQGKNHKRDTKKKKKKKIIGQKTKIGKVVFFSKMISKKKDRGRFSEKAVFWLDCLSVIVYGSFVILSEFVRYFRQKKQHAYQAQAEIPPY